MTKDCVWMIKIKEKEAKKKVATMTGCRKSWPVRVRSDTRESHSKSRHRWRRHDKSLPPSPDSAWHAPRATFLLMTSRDRTRRQVVLFFSFPTSRSSTRCGVAGVPIASACVQYAQSTTLSTSRASTHSTISSNVLSTRHRGERGGGKKYSGTPWRAWTHLLSMSHRFKGPVRNANRRRFWTWNSALIQWGNQHAGEVVKFLFGVMTTNAINNFLTNGANTFFSSDLKKRTQTVLNANQLYVVCVEFLHVYSCIKMAIKWQSC